MSDAVDHVPTAVAQLTNRYLSHLGSVSRVIHQSTPLLTVAARESAVDLTEERTKATIQLFDLGAAGP
jgi:hypothetical protein